mmetsp:Transcript_38826/g.123429  ORF Transcript_38826/g.123429 Transcript_38826/m.123429 type:complete len:237 (+) Transcript_38826:505-1215(+)
MRADGPVDLGHLSAGPREEARARVGNGRAAPSAELDGGGGARGERHRVHVELPVPGLGDGCPRVLADEVCGVHAADDHLAPGGGPGLAVQPEGEDWRVHQPLLEEVVKGRDDPVHRDGLEAEAEDAVKLCRNESKPGLLQARGRNGRAQCPTPCFLQAERALLGLLQGAVARERGRARSRAGQARRTLVASAKTWSSTFRSPSVRVSWERNPDREPLPYSIANSSPLACGKGDRGT